MTLLIDQKEHLRGQIARIEAEDGGPSVYTDLIRAQIARMEAVEDDNAADVYSVFIGAGKKNAA